MVNNEMVMEFLFDLGRQDKTDIEVDIEVLGIHIEVLGIDLEV